MEHLRSERCLSFHRTGHAETQRFPLDLSHTHLTLRSTHLTPQFTATAPHSHLRGGRAAGLIMLFVGAALLVYVFLQSYAMLTNPIPGMSLPLSAHSSSAAASSGSNVDFGRLGTATIAFLLKLAVLLVMTIVGSVIAARGVHLYYVASGTLERTTGAGVGAGAGSVAAVAPSMPSLSISDAPSDPSSARLTGGQRQ